MSKNGFGKSGNALLRRRWMTREQKRKDAQNVGRKENCSGGMREKHMDKRGGSIRAE